MKIKLYYDKYQMEDAIKFIVEKNKWFKEMNASVRARIIEVMMSLAKNPEKQLSSTMGFLIVISSYEKEGMDHDESSAYFSIYVDPSLGCMDFDEGCEEVDV